jgi:predicted outer membrane protein
MQSGVARLNSQNEVAAAQALQQQQMQFDSLKAQMDEATEQQRLGILDRQTQATLANSISSVMDNVQTAAGVLRQTLASTPDDADKTSIRDAITGMEARLEALVTQFNELTGVRPAPIGAATPTGAFDITPEADEVYRRWAQ